MRILFIGDIVAQTGRLTVKALLADLVRKHRIDFVIANAENATHGKGLIRHHYVQLMEMGIDAFTLGNHFKDRNELENYIDGATEIVRPLNINFEYPGVGTTVFTNEEGISIRVTNLLGQVFMGDMATNPFVAMEKLLEKEEKATIHIVDFHAEASSEKQAFFYAFAGKVTAVIGTHTHVQTRDYRIFDCTGYIGDVGMTGPYNGILGTDREQVIERFWHEGKGRFSYDKKDDGVFSAVVIDVDEMTGKCREIFPIYQIEKAEHLYAKTN